MKVDNHTITVTLTREDVSTWMSALRIAAIKKSTPTVPWDRCCFYLQHREVERITGVDSGETANLYTVLEEKSKR